MTKRPNILFIHVDQMHFEAMSAYGNKYVKTPAMDRIAADGCSFRASYSANPVCCPARASWYTGRMSSEHGQANNGGYPIRKELPDLGSWLREHGDYETAYSGKWHVSGRKREESFKVLYGQPESKGEIFDAAVGRACMGFLDNYTSDKPFFLNCGFVNPHDCCYTYGAQGGEGKFAFDEEVLEEMPPIPENFYIYRGKKLKQNKQKERFFKYYMHIYYRWVEMVDAEIGRLYDALMKSRFADNTVVIFSADHGEGLGFHGQVSKSMMVESSWRVPMIIVTPDRRRKGQQDNDHLSIAVDIPATICDYAEVEMLPKMTIGKSLRPLVENKKVDDWHEYIVGENWQGTGKIGVRDARHKTIFYGDGVTNIFDLQADPMEMNDLFATREGKGVLAKHKKYLREYVSKLEIYEPAKIKDNQKAYQVYLDWYRKAKEEVLS
jgi:choline-sulfatase